MFAVLFGSYSIPTTFAGIPSFLLRLKSTSLYFFLFPPPWCLTVILPWLLRPAFFCKETSKDFSGVFFVISEKSEPVIFLLEGVYGLYVLIPIVFLLSIVYYRTCLCLVSKEVLLTVLRRFRYLCCPLLTSRLLFWS